MTNNTSAANLAFGQTFMNQYTLELVHKYPSIFSNDTMYLQTYPNQQWYTLPNYLRKINTIVINVGNAGSAVPTTVSGAGFNWPVRECASMDEFNRLNMTNNITSDIPLYYIYYNGQLGIYPKPAGGYNPITIRGQVEVTSTSQSDTVSTQIVTIPYTQTLVATPSMGDKSAMLSAAWTLPTNTYQMQFSDGETILVTLTLGSIAVTWSEALAAASSTSVSVRTAGGGDIVTGLGTAFTPAMVGQVISITQPTGDGHWYIIGTYYNVDTVALTQTYGGGAITGGTASCIIGQANILPPAYQLIPLYRACEIYYTIKAENEKLQAKYKSLADDLAAQMEDDYGNTSLDPTINDRFDIPLVNPNLFVNITGSSQYQ
jgi:hypothetical protein